MRLPESANRLLVGVISVIEAEDDPEDTMQVALTHRDLASVVFGIVVLSQIFPELSVYLAPTMDKLKELSEFQQFLPVDEREG